MSFINLFLKSKWDFSKIKKKKFLLVDGNYNPFTKYYSKKDFNVLFRRGESINIRILIKCIFDLNITSLNYFKHFIENSKPRLILTAFDYHPIFYKLRNITNIKTLMIQKGKRTYSDNIFKNKIFIQESLNENFFVDYIFLYNKYTCDKYKKLVKGKYFSIGSFENNFKKLKFNSQKKEILFISNFKMDNNNRIEKNCENDELVVFHLHKLALKNKIKFNILPKHREMQKNEKEFKFYKNILKGNFKFIKRNNVSNAYDISSRFKYIFCTYSTLGVENLSKGGRSGFIFFKSKNNPCRYYRFGSLEKIALEGPFWTSDYKFNLEKLNRVFNYVIKTKKSVWDAKSKTIGKKIIEFDFDNKIFRNIVDRELKKKIIE